MISLLVPTRSRPAAAAEMWTSALVTADHPDDLELVLYLDSDDPDPVEPDRLPGHVVGVLGRRIVLSECWNQAAVAAAGELLWHGADDVRFRTSGWDTAVRDTFEEYPDRIVFVHGRDGIHDQALGTHGWLHRRWFQTVGTFVPPYFSCDFNDTWLTEVADQLGRRRYLPDVFTEHLHPIANKADWDDNHRERLARGEADNVAGRYDELAPERAEWAAKLRAVMA